MSRVVGRRALLSEVHDLLGRGRSVALTGPTGIGKSALLDALETASDALVLRAGAAEAEHLLPFAALQDLIDQLPAERRATLPDPARGRLAEGLAGAGVAAEFRSVLCDAFRALLADLAAERPVLLLLDDVQWLDPESACVIGYGRRRLPGRVGLVATVGPAGPGERIGIDLTDLQPVEVPPLDAGDMVDLLVEHGLSAHVAQRLYVESGGLPALALALCGAVGEQPTLLGRPTPMPPSIARVLLERFLAQPDPVRETLQHAALLHRPTARQLERAGRIAAEEHVRHALGAGLVTRVDETIRFAPAVLRTVIADATPAVRRAELHRDLATAASGEAERMRHTALADPRPDADLARALEVAARESAAAGAREIATELYVLAADHAPLDLADERVEWLATAVETGAPGNHVELVHRALADFLDARGTPEQTVRVRLALPELAGSGVAAMDEVLTAALADAGEDDRLVAMVLLQRSRVALMESRPDEAARRAERAAGLLARAGDRAEQASALTTLAVATRWTGSGEHDTHLAAALALGAAGPAGMLHTSPAYVAARFALYDDRLDEAWRDFRAMLAQVERGAGTDQVHVLRCLVEVGVRLGRCREASEYAARAARVGEEFGLDLHTGWFITGLAELAGGDLQRARTLAEHGVAATEERGDTRYLQRHLLLLGQVLLRTGDAQGARTTLARVRDIERTHGISDPTVNRWQPDLVAALVALGRLDEAESLVGESRRRLDGRAGTSGVAAQLDRAEAELLVARGDVPGALLLLERAEKVCADIGLRLDLGRTLLTRAHLERRRRRAAAARTALEAAQALFVELHARSWVDQVARELSPGRADVAGPLTDTEARIAREVAQGASNREIAERLFLSVKTVEATLTRIYRKLDVRSRTQLAAQLPLQL